MERLWQPYHIVSSSFYIFLLFNSAFQFVLSPLYFLHSFIAILFAQLILFTLSVYPLYKLTKEKLGHSYYAMLVSVAFLLYFPASGILWFDVHFQSFFVPIFIFAYYFYSKERYMASAIFFLLSGTVRFPYMILPFLFSFLELLTFLFNKSTIWNKKKFYANFVVFTIAIVLLAGGFYYNDIASSPTFLTQASLAYPARLLSLILTLLVIMGPFLFIPLIRFRWLVLSLPFFLLGVYTGSANYTFPIVMSLQYTSMIVPIVFLGFIEGMETHHRKNHLCKTGRGLIPKLMEVKSLKRVSGKFTNKRSTILGAILCILVVGSLFYQPYGPLNDVSNFQYHITNDVGFNSTNYNTLMKLVNMVPKNNPYVLFQNDMPEMLPRPSISPIPFLSTIYISSNISVSEVSNNSFPLINTISINGQNLTNVHVDYILAYNKSSSYTLQFSSSQATMKQLVQLAINSGKYSIIGGQNGFMLLERN